MKKLDDYLDDCAEHPFTWLAHDCVSFAGHWIREKRGEDVLPEYHEDMTLLHALRILKSLGGYYGLADSRFGVRVGIQYMQRGDVALVPSGKKVGQVSGFSFGICTGTHIVVRTRTTLVFVPNELGVAAWRV